MKFTLLLALVALCSGLSAQSLDEVFADGGATTSDNVIKVNLAGLYRGQAILSYERLLADQRIGIEASLGFGLGFYRPDVLSRSIESFNYEMDGVSGGNSISLTGRRYLRPVNKNTWSYAVRASNRGFSFEDPDREGYRVTDLGFGGGYTLMVSQRLMVDLLYLVSFRLYGDAARRDLEPRSTDTERLSWAIPTLDISVGNLF